MARRFLFLGAALLAVGLAAGSARAFSVTLHFGNPNSYYAADVTFSQAAAGGNIDITLTNTSTLDLMLNEHLLNAVFFDINTSALTPVSALIPVGSSVVNPSSLVTNVGGEWRYDSGRDSSLIGATEGISSVGFGVFGSNANFNGPNLVGNNPIDGGDGYGITSAGDKPWTNNGAGNLSTPMVMNSIVFTLGVPVNSNYQLLAGDISNVSVQYGTSLGEPRLPRDEVPIPGTVLLLGSGLAGLGIIGRRKEKKA